jgi:hypothetical protein
LKPGYPRREEDQNRRTDRRFSERFCGCFERRFGGRREEDQVSASFENGGLTLMLPKSPAPCLAAAGLRRRPSGSEN